MPVVGMHKSHMRRSLVLVLAIVCFGIPFMLRLKQLGIDTCHETMAFLARRCPLYRAQEFVALARIEISGAGRRIVATLNIVDDE